jgi:heterodisulfide reductase subunit C
MPKNKQSDAFLSELMNFPSLRKIRLCMQCGTCSGSCPMSDQMEYTPSQLIAMVRAGMREEVLTSRAPFQCISCYICSERCPHNIKVADIIYALKRLAMKDRKASSAATTPAFYRSFNRAVFDYGRIVDLRLMLDFYRRTNPLQALADLPLAWQLFSHRRLSLRGPGITPAAAREVRTILKKTADMGVVDEEL